MSFRTPERSSNFSFDLTGKRGAALVTRYPTYWEDSPLEGAFENYTRRYYNSWVTFAREKQYGDIQPVLLSGFDVTKDFAMVAYSNANKTLGSDLAINVPLWGTWHARSPPYINNGPIQHGPPHKQASHGFPSPQPIDAGSIPNEFNQYVFIRYYTMRPKKWRPMLSKEVFRAGMGQRGSGSGSNRRDTLPTWFQVVRSDTNPSTISDGDPRGWLGPTDDTESETDSAVGSTQRVWFLRSRLFML